MNDSGIHSDWDEQMACGGDVSKHDPEAVHIAAAVAGLDSGAPRYTLPRVAPPEAWVRVVAIAKVAHEANRAYCQTLGDYSQPTWETAPDWQRSSAIDGVHFVTANPTAGDSASHDNWSREKLAAGWKYGPVKNPDAKEHPCLVPFGDLPPEQQAKDRLFRSVVLALAGVAVP